MDQIQFISNQKLNYFTWAINWFFEEKANFLLTTNFDFEANILLILL